MKITTQREVATMPSGTVFSIEYLDGIGELYVKKDTIERCDKEDGSIGDYDFYYMDLLNRDKGEMRYGIRGDSFVIWNSEDIAFMFDCLGRGLIKATRRELAQTMAEVQIDALKTLDMSEVKEN